MGPMTDDKLPKHPEDLHEDRQAPTGAYPAAPPLGGASLHTDSGPAPTAAPGIPHEN